MKIKKADTKPQSNIVITLNSLMSAGSSSRTKYLISIIISFSFVLVIFKRIILFNFWIDVNILHKGGLLMKNLWTKIFIGVLIGILIGTALLITLYFVSVSLFWNQP